MAVPDPSDPCPCGAGPYGEGCGRFHDGEAAPTAETLMRSRYSAYALGRVDYLIATLAPEQREPGLRASLEQSCADTAWLGLTVLATRAGGPDDVTGTVEFRAVHGDPDEPASRGYIQELSRFEKRDGRWLYVDGRHSRHGLGRNDRCWCLSGKKLKSCHKE